MMTPITQQRLDEIEERVKHIAAFTGFPYGLKKDVLDLIAALRSLPAVNGWIPVVERLPEPDKPVLASYKLDNGRSWAVRAVYIPKYWKVDDGSFEGETEYSEEKDETYWPEGWYEFNDFDEAHWLVREMVTHWQPLPAAPEGEKPLPTLVCEKCGADRYKEPCKGDWRTCPMAGAAAAPKEGV